MIIHFCYSVVILMSFVMVAARVYILSLFAE